MTTPLSIGGKGIRIDYTNKEDPELRIPYSAIAGAINWSNTPTLDDENLTPWLQGFLQNCADYNFNNPTDETVNVVVLQPIANAPATRNKIPNRQNNRYQVTFWGKQIVTPIIKGDDL